MKWILFILTITGLLCAQSVEECMECHGDPDLTKFINDSTEISLYVDLDHYDNSVHAGFECIDCHADIEDAFHEEDLEDVNCAICHDYAQEEFEGSVHQLGLQAQDVHSADCKDCHGTHNILYSDDSLSMTFKLNIENTCGNCHSRPDVLRHLGILGDGPVSGYHNSVHNKILNENPEKNAPTCVSCHGYHDIVSRTSPDYPYALQNLPLLCGKCHEKSAEEYKKSIHWLAVQRGHFESPVCNDCHGEHQVQSPDFEDAVTNRLNLSSQLCASCHSSKVMMERFGLDHRRFESYMRSYHGLAGLKGSIEAANCVSCHEVHAIRSETSPESSVHANNLEKTCGKCHENISAQFIAIPVHPIGLKERNIIGFYAQNFYIWMIILVIGAMIIHNIIILSYFVRRKRKQHLNEGMYQRFRPFEVYQHALLLTSFIILVITGFALKFPDAFWVKFLVGIGMNEEIRSIGHRIAAVVLIVISFVQIGYFMFSRSGRKEIWSLRPGLEDVTGFWDNIKYHLMLSKKKPKFGRWDYTEKAEYLALIWGTAVMALTGLVLWFPEFFMRFLPSWMFEVSEIIHYYEAWLATLAIIFWHWFFVIYHPERYPVSLTFIDGKISQEEMKHHHPLEYEKLKDEDESSFGESKYKG